MRFVLLDGGFEYLLIVSIYCLLTVLNANMIQHRAEAGNCQRLNRISVPTDSDLLPMKSRVLPLHHYRSLGNLHALSSTNIMHFRRTRYPRYTHLSKRIDTRNFHFQEFDIPLSKKIMCSRNVLKQQQ